MPWAAPYEKEHESIIDAFVAGVVGSKTKSGEVETFRGKADRVEAMSPESCIAGDEARARSVEVESVHEQGDASGIDGIRVEERGAFTDSGRHDAGDGLESLEVSEESASS